MRIGIEIIKIDTNYFLFSAYQTPCFIDVVYE